MGKLIGAGIGFLSVGGLVYLAVIAGTSTFGHPGWQVDCIRIFVGISASVLGGVIGAVVGAVVGARIWPGTVRGKSTVAPMAVQRGYRGVRRPSHSGINRPHVVNHGPADAIVVPEQVHVLSGGRN